MKPIIHSINLRIFLVTLSLFIAVLTLWNSCRDELKDKTFLTTDDVSVVEYILQENPPTMTKFLEIAEKADLRGMIHAYEIKTCFIPTNDAIDEYLRSIDKSSVDQLSQEECADFVRFHTVSDTLSTIDFIDGRMRIANMRKIFLTTRTRYRDNRFVLQVNRQADVLEADIRVGNGIIHKVDHVLTPPALTVGEQIRALPRRYYDMYDSIMYMTGWIDTLNRKGSNVWYTVFLQDNESFSKSGIFFVKDVVERMKIHRYDIVDAIGEDDPKRLKDSLLWTFAAYNCVRGLNYVYDLTMAGSMLTAAPNQAITFQLVQDAVLVNEYVDISGNVEKGVPIKKSTVSEYTDLSCNNGVLIDMGGYIGPRKRRATPLYWDVCLQPEFMKDSRFRRGGWNLTRAQFEELSDIKSTFIMNAGGTDFGYEYQGGYADNWALVNFDALKVNFYRLSDLSFKLPILNEGTYKVWLCYRRADTQDCTLQGTFLQEGHDDQQMANRVMVYDYHDTQTDPRILELTRGMKRYVAKHRSSTCNSYLLGIIEVKTTGRHTLRLDVIKGGRNTQVWIDMIHFIPDHMDQLTPVFDKMGTAHQWPCTPCNLIWPFDNLTCPAADMEGCN